MVIEFTNQISYYIFAEHYKDSSDIEFYLYDGHSPRKNPDVVEICLSTVIEPMPNAKAVSDFVNTLDKSIRYFGLWHYGEGMTPRNQNWKALLEAGIPIYSSTYEPELLKYENFYYDFTWSFHYFNILAGYCYVESHNLERVKTDKKYKVGFYGVTKWKETKFTKRTWRNEYIDWFSEKSDVYVSMYQSKYYFGLSERFRNQTVATAYDFRHCKYFLTPETHFGVMPNSHLPYFTSEKIMKAAFMELFDVNTICITSPAHLIELHNYGFKFANSKFIKNYTPEEVLNSAFEVYNTDEIIETNNIELINKIRSENIFKKYNIV